MVSPVQFFIIGSTIISLFELNFQLKNLEKIENKGRVEGGLITFSHFLWDPRECDLGYSVESPLKREMVFSRLVNCCLNNELALLPLLSGVPSALRSSQAMVDWRFALLCLVFGWFCGFICFRGSGFVFDFVRVFRWLGYSCHKNLALRLFLNKFGWCLYYEKTNGAKNT